MFFQKKTPKLLFSKIISSNLMFVGLFPSNLTCFLFIFGVIGGSWGDFFGLLGSYYGPIMAYHPGLS